MSQVAVCLGGLRLCKISEPRRPQARVPGLKDDHDHPFRRDLAERSELQLRPTTTPPPDHNEDDVLEHDTRSLPPNSPAARLASPPVKWEVHSGGGGVDERAWRTPQAALCSEIPTDPAVQRAAASTAPQLTTIARKSAYGTPHPDPHQSIFGGEARPDPNALPPPPSNPTSTTPHSPHPMPPNPSPFLALPPELRAAIYTHLPTPLIHPTPLIYCLSTTHPTKSHPLTTLNRALRAEALAIYYSQNTWLIKLEDAAFYDAFRAWIAGVGRAVGYLRRVRVCVRAGVVGRCKEVVRQRSLPSVAASLPVYYHRMPEEEEGEAMLEIDLSERGDGPVVRVLRCDAGGCGCGGGGGGGCGREVVCGVVREAAVRLWDVKHGREDHALVSALARQDAIIVTYLHAVTEVIMPPIMPIIIAAIMLIIIDLMLIIMEKD
ncbi:hypothetical protein EJ05DRAFT_503910 [Pseudovirgaria hyperparasitica]|uniref:F-box domain-containing protein n=1 Tax=Pseudovirgaria hyperparasitica TaxID=470096 RepID=A0A6A6VUY2_9PEZI|nr:uncharacterized protein EJ05DRAFT_503910 [Pseudovirgaria hyperparasitica]KAF2754372.1 hypothetical protein EJ05DRAFT_503910 [Pseudovirgaria hyperparasitica]